MDKEGRTHNYDKKKHREGKEKYEKETLNEQETQLLSSLETAAPEKLLSFMEDKYDKVCAKNEKLGFKINNVLIKRLQSLPTFFRDRQKQKVTEMFRKQNYKISEESVEQIFTKRSHQISSIKLQKLKLADEYGKNSRFMKFIFNFESPDMYIRKVRVDEFPKVDAPVHKRMKKDAIEILEGFMKFQKETDIAENQFEINK